MFFAQLMRDLGSRHPPGQTIIFRRAFTLHHLDKSFQKSSMEEKISYGDYSILRRQRNKISEDLHPHLVRITSLTDFVRNVKDCHSTVFTIRPLTRHTSPYLEANFSIFLHSLHYATFKGDSMPRSFSKVFSKLPREAEFYNEHLKLTPDQLLQNAVRANPNFAQEVKSLLNLYDSGRSDIESTYDENSLRTVVASYAWLKMYLKDKYSVQDVMGWVSCVLAQNVTDCCFSLSGRKNFPTFIIRDLMSRRPSSEYEFDLMYELLDPYIKSTSYIPHIVIENMIFYANQYKFNKLEDLMRKFLQKETFLREDVLNKTITLLSDVSGASKRRQHYLSILAAQRLLVDALLNKKLKITSLGYLGIAGGLLPLSMERAEKFYSAAIGEGLETKEEEKLSSIISFRLSRSPESLMQAFDDSASKELDDPKIWKELMVGLQKFEVLNKDNTSELLSRLNDTSYNEAKSWLLSYQSTSEILQHGNIDNNRSLAAALQKLYKSKDEEFKIYSAGVDYARNIFHSIPSPSRYIVGEVLLGECYYNPDHSYELYKSLLFKHCDDIPNEKALLSLIVPAMRDRRLVWENRFASQIAVHEFRKHCKRSIDDIQATLIPSNSLWKPYLRLLGVSNYQDELSEVIKIWENLNVIPERETLAILLGAMPEGVGEAKRKHAQQYLVPVEEDESSRDLSETPPWDWPEDYEIEYWRSALIGRRR